MRDLFEKLAGLADELDKIDSPEIADEVDSIMNTLKIQEPSLLNELIERARRQDKLPGICMTCGGSGGGIDSPWCEDCNGSGKGDFIVESALNKLALKPPYVRRRGNKWVVLDKHTGKVLSKHDTEEKAKDALKAMHVRK